MPFSPRTTSVIKTTILNAAALSGVVSMADFAYGLVCLPAAWTAASIAFQVCDSFGGTFIPLRTSAGAIVEITSPATGAAAAYPLPAELLSCQYFKVWSAAAGAGTDTNQGADRLITIMLKS